MTDRMRRSSQFGTNGATGPLHLVLTQPSRESLARGEAGMVEDYRAHMEQRNLRPNTVEARIRLLRRFERTSGPIELAVADDFTTWFARRVAPETKATELSGFRGFYRWAIRQGALDIDPTARIDRPRLARRFPRPMPDALLAFALDRSPDRVRHALHFAAYAGLRACEIAPLHTRHLLWDAMPPLVMIEEGKGGDTGSVPMSPILVELRDELPSRGHVFPRRDGHPGHIAPHLVSHTVNQWLHSHDIWHTLHTARHWFGTHAYQSTGRDLRSTQELMRHRSVVSTQIYTYVDPGPLVSAVAALPRLAG
jgi:integrase/recombinase XerD